MKNYINKPDILKWYVYKILLIMRLTTVILMVSMLQVSAATVAQEFNYVKKGVSLIQIFKEIKKQTGYNIIWNEKKIDVTTTIDADFKKATIRDVLNKCLKNLPLSYTINDKMVMIKENEPSFRDKIVSFFSAIDVRGRVVDENNAPLVGAVVKVKGTSISTPTNSNGEFVLRNVDESATLIISYLGYEKQELKAFKNIGSIRLMPSTDKLQEVEINAGYYTLKDREKTGSISIITSKSIEKQVISNPLQAMQGTISGVQVIQNSGVPGGSFTVQIRGQNSIANGNDPLYIIDGVPFSSRSLASSSSLMIANANPLSSLSPSDIESITVLKDADATAIYGSRGANGVILITTKRGKKGKAKFDFNMSQGLGDVPQRMKLMNTEQYLLMRNEAFANDNVAIAANQYDLNGTWNTIKYTDWQKELIGGNAHVTDIQASLSGGDENLNYLIRGAYYRETTVFDNNQNFHRPSILFNLGYSSSNKKFLASFSGNYSTVTNKVSVIDPTMYIVLPPNYPDLLKSDGSINWDNGTMYVNPYSNILQKHNAITDNMIGNGMVSYEPVHALKIQVSFGFTKTFRNEFSGRPLASYSPALGFTSANRTASFINNQISTWITEPQISWVKKLGQGQISILLGTSFQESISQGKNIRASGFNSDELIENIASAPQLTTQQLNYNQYKYSAIYSRVNYSLLNRYFINLTARRDGSSRFGPEKGFANFGAVGSGWVFSDEPGLAAIKQIISFGKLRTSYGITGNDQIQDYGYHELWTPTTGIDNTYQGAVTLSPSSISNPEYAWEINKKFEVALELGLMKNFLSLNVNYFNTRSSNQLIRKSLPPSVGFANIQDNLPAKVQNTGFEFDLSIDRIRLGKVSWSTNVNLTIPKNKLLEYPGLEKSSNAVLYQIGYPLSIKKSYNVLGVDQVTGLYKFEDYDGDGAVTNNDRYIIKKLGRQFFGGLQSTLKYMNWELSFLIQAVKQTTDDNMLGIGSPGRFAVDNPLSNQADFVTDRWTSPESIGNYQKYSTTSAANINYSNARGNGGRFITDASYIRLKNISLAYSFPKNLIRQLNFSNLRVFIHGNNLLTITNYKGLDPETINIQKLPPVRLMTLGVQFLL